jgi:hypothetical protein
LWPKKLEKVCPFAVPICPPFAQADVGVEIDMRMLPGEKEKAVRLAKLIASRI